MINKRNSLLSLSFMVMSFQLLWQQTKDQLIANMELLEWEYTSLKQDILHEQYTFTLAENLVHNDSKIDTNDIQFLCEFPAPQHLFNLEDEVNNYINKCNNYIDTIINNQIITNEILTMKNTVQSHSEEIQNLLITYKNQHNHIIQILKQIATYMTSTNHNNKNMVYGFGDCNNYEQDLYRIILTQKNISSKIESSEHTLFTIFPDIQTVWSSINISNILWYQDQYYDVLYEEIKKLLILSPVK